MGFQLEGRPIIGQIPLLIFTYLGFSFFLSGFIMTVLAYAPADSYLMNMIQDMNATAFVGPIVLIIGLIMLVVAISYCSLRKRNKKDEDYDDDDDDDV